MIVTVLSYVFGLLNLKYMLILFLAYGLFGAMLTVNAFLTRNFLSDTKISFGDVIKAFLICIPENMLIRFIMAWTRMAAILFYKKSKTNWGQIKRYKINYDNKKTK